MYHYYGITQRGQEIRIKNLLKFLMDHLQILPVSKKRCKQILKPRITITLLDMLFFMTVLGLK